MTESEWLTSTDPARMLQWIAGNPADGFWLQGVPIPSDRKLRLFACACCRSVWHLLTDDSPCPCKGTGQITRLSDAAAKRDCQFCGCRLKWRTDTSKPFWWCPQCMSSPKQFKHVDCDCSGTGRINRSRKAVEVAERYADGEASFSQLAVALSDADAYWLTLDLGRSDQEDIRRAALAASWVSPIDTATGNSTDLPTAIEHVLQYTGDGFHRPAMWQADMLRHIVGNPFSPMLRPEAHNLGRGCNWLTPTITDLAASLYSGADCSFALSDALAEAGQETLSQHFRGEREHVKGCWANDLILGKE